MNQITRDNIELQNSNWDDIDRSEYLRGLTEHLIKKANEIVERDANYTIRLVQLRTETCVPMKLKIWVENIKDRKLFYNPDVKGQNHVHRIWYNSAYSPSMEHLIDVEEF